MRGFSNLASSANYQALATSFSCILATFTWFSLEILAALRRSVMSIATALHPRASQCPKRLPVCNLLKSNIVPGLCSRGAVNNPWCKISVCFYWFFIILCRNLVIPSFSSLGLPWEEPDLSLFSRLFMSQLV